MKCAIGESVWVRVPAFGDNKQEGVLEFEKGNEIVVSFSEYEYLCVCSKSQIVDPPSEIELEIERTNKVISDAYEKAKTQDWDFYRVLEEFGYKLVKMECRK